MPKQLSEIQDHLTKEQLVILHLSKKNVREKTTIEEIEKKFNMSRSTAHDLLNRLQLQGIVKAEKADRKIVYYLPKPEYYEKFQRALSDLQSAYAYALDQVRAEISKELKSKRADSGE